MDLYLNFWDATGFASAGDELRLFILLRLEAGNGTSEDSAAFSRSWSSA
jgi:hypothetical protein